MRSLIVLCSLSLLLSGCASMLVTGGTQAGIAVAENRSIGRKVDDTVLYTDLTNQFVQADKAELLRYVSFNVRYARVMLTGNVKSEEDAAQAVALCWKAKGVTEVINELVVNPNSTLMDTAGDSFIKRNLESRLLLTKGVWVINYSMDVTNGVAYLIGRVKDQAEFDRALNVARTTKGVKRVVSHLQINPDTAHPTAAPTDATYGGGNSASYGSSNASSSSYAPATPSGDSNSIYTGPVYGSGSSGSISSAPLSAPKQPAGGGY